MNNSTLAQRGAAKLQGRTSPPHPTVHHGVTIVSLLADSVRSMGNTGGFSSVGPSTPVEGLSFSSDLEASGQAEGGFRHGGGAALSDSQLRELAQSFQVSKKELQVLWERFQALGPSDEGILDRSVFQRPPYSEDIFCRQIWKRFTGSQGAPHKISFPSFARSMIWWQKAPINYKLELLFSWMRDVDGITPHVLSKILKHVLPDYQEDELVQISKHMITAINPTADPLMVRLQEFQQWMGQLPEERLRDALDFKILHIDAGTKQ